MRFLSSSALASAEKLRLAASCSAADTMGGCSVAPGGDRRGGVSALYSHHGACSPVARGGAKMITDPPAPSTAAMADLEAPHTENATLLLIVPEPSRRTPPFGLRSTPAFTSV